MSASNPHSRSERALHLGWFCAPRLASVAIDGAPEWMRDVRLLFVTDVHLRRWVSDARLEDFIAQLADAGADMLLLGGDYAESRRDCQRFFRALARLRFPLGAFCVPGNNDHKSRDDLRKLAADAGVTLLVNESRRVTLPGGILEIGGVDEHKRGDPRSAGLFSNGGAYRILLSHFPAPPDCACELMLAGHTHGGQLCPFGLTPYSVGFERKYRLMAVKGLHRFEDMRLFIGSGIGVSKLPMRLNAEPEIDLIRFSSNFHLLNS